MEMSRQTDVTVVEPDHPVTPIAQSRAELRRPAEHLRGQTVDQHDRGRAVVSEGLVRELDASAGIG